jgi:alkylated DNA repair dioxygenase AlkB
MGNEETPDFSTTSVVIPLVASESCTVSLHENALDPAESMPLLTKLFTDLPWNVETDQFGLQSRPTCYYGDPDCVFTYVGLRLEPKPWHPIVLALKNQVAKACHLDPCLLTACLINLYPSGEGYIPWHYDEIRAHGDSKIVASLSLGGPRPFQLRSRKDATTTLVANISLESGSVLLMKGDVQEHYEHQLPLMQDNNNKDTKAPTLSNPPRISLTFRSIVPGFERGREIATDACFT